MPLHPHVQLGGTLACFACAAGGMRWLPEVHALHYAIVAVRQVVQGSLQVCGHVD